MLRFRPIMMTTMAAMLGALPLAIGLGEGGELRQPLGIAIVGGTDPEPSADALFNAGYLCLHGPVPVLEPASQGRQQSPAYARCNHATGRVAVAVIQRRFGSICGGPLTFKAVAQRSRTRL
jgi:hypothetical protein